MEKSPLFRDESYYRLDEIQANDRKEEERALLVNCCGFSSFGVPFRIAAQRKDYYLICPIDGHLEISAPCRHTLRPGELVIFSPDTPFAYTSHCFTYYWVHFSGTAAAALLQDSALQTDVPLSVGVSEESERRLRRIFYSFAHRTALWERTAALDLEAFLLLCGQAYAKERTDKSAETVTRAVTYIRTHLNEPISVEALAEQSYLSPSGFRRAFVAYTGRSPAAFIQAARMELATQLLRDTELKVAEVAICAGYADPLYFSRLFRARYGKSPLQYRTDARSK